MKKVISKETLLAYPDFNEEFVIHTDASHTQLGAVINQYGQPIAFYSRKLNDAQTRYTNTERELLAIVETLQEFRNILLGQNIKAYTDHKNLTYKNFNTERVMRWRIVLEEYGPELIYIKGEANIVADALSRMEMDSKNIPTTDLEQAEAYGTDKISTEIFPLNYQLIAKYQENDKEIQKSTDKYVKQSFDGGESKPIELYCKDKRIVVPKKLQKHIVKWYHEVLCYPGMNRTEESI